MKNYRGKAGVSMSVQKPLKKKKLFIFSNKEKNTLSFVLNEYIKVEKDINVQKTIFYLIDKIQTL